MIDQRTNERIHFDPLIEILNHDQHEALKHKVIELYEKWRKKEVTIGFTGHFSAGKSSMINALLNETILPSSPIPTSANIVEIRSGEENVIYQMYDGTYTEDDEVNEERIQQLSKNGEVVESVHIYKPNAFIKDQITLMDTPGIDSSDDAEFDRTLSKVHLIDLFVYVMDYNHVLSEVNFRFLKELERRGIPYFVVINQIDKHQEEELLFDSYKQRLRVSYGEWDLSPDEIFYTSLKNYDLLLNQFDSFKQSLVKQMDALPNRLSQKIKRELSLIIEEWKSEATGNTGQEELLNRLQLIEEQKRRLVETMDGYEQTLRDELNNVLANAYLMTFDTRELAKSFLESQQQNFKVGGLFSKKKTEAAKKERIEQFLNKLNERIQSEMVWAIRAHLEEVIHDLSSEKDLMQQIQRYSFTADEQLIQSEVNPSAQVTGDYVLLYTKALQQEIQRQMMRTVQPLIRAIQERKLDEYQKQYDQLKEEEADILTQTNQDVVSEINKKIEQLHERMYAPPVHAENELSEATYQEVLSKRSKKGLHQLLEATKVEEAEEGKAASVVHEDQATLLDYQKIEKEVQTIVEESKSLPLVKTIVSRLENRLNQVIDQEYTVALFGAFSAGKSSFANILLGNQLLPVSPNPTTAAINKIRPTSKEHSHGTVIVHFKSDEMMQEQLQQILAPFTKRRFTSLNEITKFLTKEWGTLRMYLERTEASFIDAYLKGIQQAKTWLSQTKTESLDTFSDYVTKEHISCFVHEVEIFYDCPLTEEGITLVDTPGADSIHARHTNVSLQYIKQADVILYVNYYNHAFSRADREFLGQLGRMSQTMTAGKMFFILNAADLANSSTELDDVKKYLDDQLTQYGIEQPTIFPISSKQLSQPDPTEQSIEQYRALETVFNHFMEYEVKEIVFQNLIGELKQLDQFILDTIDGAKQNSEQQRAQIDEDKRDRDQLENELNRYDDGVQQNTLSQEITELTHYLSERLDIQSIEWLKEAINPATIQSNGRKGKEELEQSIQQTVQLVKQKLSKEFYQIDLLLDDQMNRLKNQLIDELNEITKMYFPQEKLFFETEDFTGTEMPDIPFDMEANDVKHFLKYFKNKKDFFEGDGRDQLFEDMTAWIGNQKTDTIKRFTIVLSEAYHKNLEVTKKNLIQELLDNLDTLRENKEMIFKNQEVIQNLEQLQKKISTMKQEHNL